MNWNASVAILPAEQLASERLDDADITVVDARRRDEFESGHIPGAVWMGWEDWCEPAPIHAGPVLGQPGYWGALADADPEEYAQRLSTAGLSDDRPIVVYSDAARSRGREGRVAWMLLYFGGSQVYLLDGGWMAWLEHGGAVEAGGTTAPRGHFTVRLQEHRRRTLRDLKEAYRTGHLPALVDTRTRAEYDGEVQVYLPRRGRLPGAALVPFADLFDSDGRYIDETSYAERVSPAVPDASALVAYCEVGVRAGVFALLHEIYTGRVVQVYDGSFIEWSLDPTLPMVCGTHRR